MTTTSGQDLILIDVMWGSQTFHHGSCQIRVNAVAKGVSVGQFSFPSDVLKKHGSSHMERAARDGDARNGEWYRSSYSAQEGVVLRYAATVTMERVVVRQVGLILRLRSTAPAFIARVHTNNDPTAVFQSVPVFAGRADILTPAEAKTLGYSLEAMHVSNFYDPEDLEEGLQIDVMAPELEPKPSIERITRADGSTAVVALPKAASRKVQTRRQRAW